MRAELKALNNEGKLIKAQEKQLRIARRVRFKYFFMSVVAACLESILKRKINIELIGFSVEASKSKNNTVEQLAARWKPVAASLFSLLATQLGDDPTELLSDSSMVAKLAETLGGIVLATNLVDQPDFKKFAKLL